MADETDVFAEAELRRKQLLQELAAAPISEVWGVVGATGPGGGRIGDEKLWTMSFSLEAWRIGSGTVQLRRLTISREVTDEELTTFQDAIVPYSVVHIKARVRVDSASGSPQALLETFVGVATSDAELNEHAKQLQKPVTMEDPFFGTLTLDRRGDWFTAAVIWEGKRVCLNLSESAEVQASLNTARSLWQDQSRWNRRIRDYAVQELLPLKNDYWLDEDEAELTPEQFEEKMTLDSITVYPDGSFDFWHDDGDLFYGHSIQIGGSLSEGPTHADIPG